MPTDHEFVDDVPQDMDDVKGLDDTGAPKGAEQPVKTESSAVADANNSDDDSLSIVRDVVAARKEQPEAAAASSASEGSEQTAPAETKERDDEDFSDVPFNKHPRFQQVLGRLKTAEVDARRYQNVQDFVDQHGLAAEEVADLIVIGGLMKTNPGEAWKRMKPIVQNVLVAAGEVMSDDLRSKVQSGEMTREAAIEVSRARAELQSVQARTQFEQNRQQAQQRSAAATAVASAISSWEAERRERDPNFEAKLPQIEREVAWLQTKEGRPNTPEGVRAQLQKAYSSVVTTAVATPDARRQRPQVRPITGGQVNGNVRPEINSTADVIRNVVARRAG